MTKRTSPFISSTGLCRNISVWGCLLVLQVLFLYCKAAKVLPLALERCSDRPEWAQNPQQGFRTFGCIRHLPSSSSSQWPPEFTAPTLNTPQTSFPSTAPEGAADSGDVQATAQPCLYSRPRFSIYFSRGAQLPHWKRLLQKARAHEQDLLGNLRKVRVHMARRPERSAWLAKKDKVPS